MGTRTYSRRAADGTRRLTALGRARAGQVGQPQVGQSQSYGGNVALNSITSPAGQAAGNLIVGVRDGNITPAQMRKRMQAIDFASMSQADRDAITRVVENEIALAAMVSTFALSNGGFRSVKKPDSDATVTVTAMKKNSPEWRQMQGLVRRVKQAIEVQAQAAIASAQQPVSPQDAKRVKRYYNYEGLQSFAGEMRDLFRNRPEITRQFGGAFQASNYGQEVSAQLWGK